MRADHQHSKPSSHIRPLALGEDGVKLPSSSANPGRFVDPGRLTEKKKAAIAKTLVDLGIGDRESCNLFVRAMEYELHVYREAAAHEAEAAELQRAPAPAETMPTAEAPELQAIARISAELAGLLEALPYEAQHGLLDNLEAQDPMQRGYDQRYLQQMQIEVLRLAAACGEAPQAPAVPETVAAPAAAPSTGESAASQYFVASLVHMFEECFERAPTADPDGDFATALGVISEGTGVPMRLDRAALELALMPSMG